MRDSYRVPSLLLGARLIDYAGMKFIYAAEIADIFSTKVGPGATRADFRSGSAARPATATTAASAISWTHHRIARTVPPGVERGIPALPPGAALGRFDGEYEYWRKFQARLWEVRRTYKEGDKLPSLDSLRP